MPCNAYVFVVVSGLFSVALCVTLWHNLVGISGTPTGWILAGSGSPFSIQPVLFAVLDIAFAVFVLCYPVLQWAEGRNHAYLQWVVKLMLLQGILHVLWPLLFQDLNDSPLVTVSAVALLVRTLFLVGARVAFLADPAVVQYGARFHLIVSIIDTTISWSSFLVLTVISVALLRYGAAQETVLVVLLVVVIVFQMVAVAFANGSLMNWVFVVVALDLIVRRWGLDTRILVILWFILGWSLVTALLSTGAVVRALVRAPRDYDPSFYRNGWVLPPAPSAPEAWTDRPGSVSVRSLLPTTRSAGRRTHFSLIKAQ